MVESELARARRHGSWWQRWSAKGDPASPPAFEGRFTTLFDEDADPHSDTDLAALAAAMTSAPENPPTPEGDNDAEENRGTADRPGIPAAYTYFGQFIDHDLTLDPTSNLHGRPLSDAAVRDLVDFRTPRFDLDCLYGRGPADQPYLYEADGLRLFLGNRMSGNAADPHSVDVPRAPNGRALIGDPRNDENRIVSQLQATMLRFHNRLVDLAERDAGPGRVVELTDVQDTVRWHYQWAVVHDFLPTIIQPDVLAEVFPGLSEDPDTTDDRPAFSIPKLRIAHASGHKPLLGLMPTEFSVAAYRFGHSMIRPIYRINQTIERRKIFDGGSDVAADLGGMRPIPSDWAVDWQFLLDIDHHGHRVHSGDDPIPRTPQFSYKIDTALVNPLGHLSTLVAVNPRSLAERNLLRSKLFQLPSGEQVAKALGVDPLPADKILIGKATGDPEDVARPITDVSASFGGNTPLWTYVLAEAWATSWQANQEIPEVDRPVKLGPVGGHIVAETFAAFLISDPGSYVSQETRFTPDVRLQHDHRFGLAEIINTGLHAVGR